MMNHELMIPVDSECIPDGWEPVRYGFAKANETVVSDWSNGNVFAKKLNRNSSHHELVIRKKYDPGIPLPKGWWLWRCFEDSTAWVASPIVGHLPGDCIWGIEHIPGFIPPSDGKPRQIK